MTRDQILGHMLDPGVIAIVRSSSPVEFGKVCEALLAGGIRAVEMTLTTPGAFESIHSVPEQIRAELAIGMGTVLSVDNAREALAHGFQFVVTPVVRLDVVAFCRSQGVPIVCGAYTPTEAQTAHEAGSDFVKISPAECGGPSFIKSMLAPLPHLRIMPTGGVTLETCRAFLDAGCVALGAGSSLVTRELLARRDWGALTEQARAFVAAAHR